MIDLRTPSGVELLLMNFQSRVVEAVLLALTIGDIQGDVQEVCGLAAKLADRCEHIAQEAINAEDWRVSNLGTAYDELVEFLPLVRKAVPPGHDGSLPSDGDMTLLRESAIAAGVNITN